MVNPSDKEEPSEFFYIDFYMDMFESSLNASWNYGEKQFFFLLFFLTFMCLKFNLNSSFRWLIPLIWKSHLNSSAYIFTRICLKIILYESFHTFLFLCVFKAEWIAVEAANDCYCVLLKKINVKIQNLLV